MLYHNKNILHHPLYNKFRKNEINPTKIFIKPFKATTPRQNDDNVSLVYHSNHDYGKDSTNISDPWREYYPIPKNHLPPFFIPHHNYHQSLLILLPRVNNYHQHHHLSITIIMMMLINALPIQTMKMNQAVMMMMMK